MLMASHEHGAIPTISMLTQSGEHGTRQSQIMGT
jgi:hypothetical protein